MVAALIFVFFETVKQNRVNAFGILFFIANMILPLVLQVVSVREEVMADRYVYVSCIGIFFIFSISLHDYLEKKISFQKVAYSLFIIYLTVIAGLTFQRSGVWKTTI